MKVAHIINSLSTGGAEKLVVELAREGSAAGDHHEIFVFSEGGGVPRNLAQELHIPVHVVAQNRFDPRIPFRLRRQCETFDVVHVHLFPALYWGSFVKKPKLFTEHSTSNRRMQRPSLRVLERCVYERYDRVIAISSGVRESLSSHVPTLLKRSRMEVIHNGISSAFFEESRRQGPPEGRVLMVGSLTPVKNVSFAIEMLTRLSTTELAVAGDGPMRGELEELARLRRVDDRVHFLGVVERVAPLMAEYDVVLIASKFEGFSLVAAEAQAVGLPIVAPRIAGLDEVVRDGCTGILYDPGSLGDAVNAVREALSPANHMDLSTSATANALRFSINRCYQEYRRVYIDLACGKNTGMGS